MEVAILDPNPWVLAGAVLLDLAIGDPVYRAHPVRLMGATLSWIEERLRAMNADGYGGGIALFFALSVLWVGGTAVLLIGSNTYSPSAALVIHFFLLYSLLAMHDLLRHAWAVEAAARRYDLDGAREAISRLVGRDTSRMDLAACRRAAIESMSENLADGYVSPLLWYVIGGIPGVVLFKVVSTMDSMVGNKTPRYLKFGWCGARLDDLMNLVPARLTWLLIAATAVFVPGCSVRKAAVIGWRQHAVVPGPNSGWSEAATAGAIERRLVGPIWAGGRVVTEVWLGHPADPPAGERGDIPRASILIGAAGLIAAALAVALTA